MKVIYTTTFNKEKLSKIFHKYIYNKFDSIKYLANGKLYLTDTFKDSKYSIIFDKNTNIATLKTNDKSLKLIDKYKKLISKTK